MEFRFFVLFLCLKKMREKMVVGIAMFVGEDVPVMEL